MEGVSMRRAPRRPALLALLLCSLALAGRPSAQYRRAPTLDDMLDLVQVSSPQISPDGRRVLFTRSEIKAWKDNRRVSTVWIANADGTQAYQFLASDRDRSPKWSPDGTLVAFLSSRDAAGGAAGAPDQEGGGQIWLIRATGGEAWKLTSHAGTIRAFEWLPDSSGLVFVSSDAKSDEQKAAEKAGDDAVYVDEGPNGQSSGSYSNLWIVSVADRRERRITQGELVVGDFEPSPDGRRVAFTYRRDNTRNGQYRSEIAVVDVATGQQVDLTRNEAPEGDLRWSPDGTQVSFTAGHDRTWELAEDKLWVVPASGGTPVRVSEAFAGTIRSYYWTPDGRAIVFAGLRRGRGGLFRLDLATRAVDAIASGDWTGNLDSVTADGRLGAMVVSSPTAAGDVHLVDLARGTLTKITDVNPQLGVLELATPRWITWKSRDGLEIEGLLWLPASHRGERLPLLVSVHGGPAGVWSASFRGINHVYASLGWAVLEPNVRGSSSYGDALLRGNLRDIGGGDYDDLMSGVDALVAQGLVDPEQLAIRGWSYGGILGGWTVTRTTRFKAASLGAMVTDWASEYAMGFNHDVRRWYIGGTPWENPDGYRQRSSYTHIAAVTTPTILFHGERDTTDTIGQSMMFYQALKDRGVPVRFLRFPREPHGFREPHHQRIRDAEEIAWLMKYTRGIAWTAPPRRDAGTENRPTSERSRER
jgi:dipeptidyl aminopeptidase/acylaminoacyl peptidase